ncbi:hypothetical protein E5A73_19550 [Sphingomonas gei]|uniref:Uncharacterized protein n=2 Tax=Sphingomonas gei TaxID=1395960 RepID=A0A4S1X166_9SPHN|nr:hypothetical protein [Sphingomonas gei]TGX49045.1 hypothetical protein E5A73_19550 [Sphingomonas gei]
MSRHDLQPKGDQPHVVRATVGWDRPLQTFFAQVFFRTEDEPADGEALIWFGTAPGELLTPEAVIAIVEPHVTIPPGLVDILNAEMRATIGVKDGTHQAHAKRSIFGSIH